MAAGRAGAGLEAANTDFFAAYVMVQAVADADVVTAARVYGYRLWELKASLDGASVMDPANFDRVTQLIREARHDLIAAIRTELGLLGIEFPTDGYNPFAGTDLAQAYAAGIRARPGTAAPWRPPIA
jgi:hypothetical protein